MNELPEPNMEWHYSTDGHRFGPLSEDQINELIKSKNITGQSFIWNKSMPEWQPVLSSKFSNLVRDPNAAPPLPGAAVNNTIVWILAFTPPIGVFIDELWTGLTGIPGFFIAILLNIFLAYKDQQKLKAAGYDTIKMGSIWLVPVYLFKRAKILKQSYAYFIVWCVLFSLFFLA